MHTESACYNQTYTYTVAISVNIVDLQAGDGMQ